MKSKKKNIFGICVFLYIFLYVFNVYADHADVFPERLITFGPSTSLEEHIQTVNQTIALVTGIEDPKCVTYPKSQVTLGDTTYCNLQVQMDKVLSEGSIVSKDKFVIYYWYPKDKVFRIKKGDVLVVSLMLTHGQNVFSAAMILRATDKVVAETKEALKKMRVNDKP